MVHVTPKPILVGERIQQLDMLLHIQEFSSMIAVITGHAQMGKTALLESAVSQLSIHHQVISFSAAETQSENQVLHLVSDQLHVNHDWQSIEQAVLDIHQQGETVNVLIDDAHLLSFELLEILAARAVNEDGWHLVLTGDDTLFDKMLQVQNDLHHSNLIHHIELAAINVEEATDFAAEFFKREGAESVAISQQKIEHLWALTSGVPGKFLDALLNEKQEKVVEASRFPLGHVAAVCLIAIALVFSSIYQEEGNELDAVEQIIASSSEIIEPQSTVAEKQAQADERLESGFNTRSKSNEIVSDTSQIDINTKPAKQPPLAVKGSEPTIDQSKALTANATLTNAPTAELKAESVVKIAESKPKPPLHPLLEAPANGFALQLLGVRNRASAEKVMAEFKQVLGSDQLSVYETTYKGQPWFVVVYGPVNTKKAANLKAGSIAKRLQNQPWVRPMAKIQEDIRRIHP